eukprot:15230610-Alexandrium_andersonii.AAC.1
MSRPRIAGQPSPPDTANGHSLRTLPFRQRGARHSIRTQPTPNTMSLWLRSRMRDPVNRPQTARTQ